MEGLFAGTPPLEALMYILHEAATQDGLEEKVVMTNDVARAFFQAQLFGSDSKTHFHTSSTC